jgi:hypothetical protein
MYFLRLLYIVTANSNTFSHSSNHLTKALAKSSFMIVLMTPYHMVLNSMKVKVKLKSSFFSVGNKKKSIGARSGE